MYAGCQFHDVCGVTVTSNLYIIVVIDMMTLLDITIVCNKNALSTEQKRPAYVPRKTYMCVNNLCQHVTNL